MPRFAPSHHRTSFHRTRTLLGFENLERREMLSAAPVVTSVEVGSTAWAPAFKQHLATSGQGVYGYAIPRGSSAQSATLNWDNIDEIMITFDKDVVVDKADLSLSGKNITQYAFNKFHYDPLTRTAKWTLSASIDRDRLRLSLDANGADPVRDLDGNVLDGEWTNNVSTTSGNGTAGGDFRFNFNVLPTDVNNTGNVNNVDYTSIRQLEGKVTTSTGYIAKRDINGDGVIDTADWQKALSRSTQALPSGVPAGTNNDSPTTTQGPLVEILDHDVDVTVDMRSYFNDLENGSSGITYTIISNDNASLFDVADLNLSTGSLTLNAASGAVGRAFIVIRGTDAGGLSVDTTVTVDVNRTNEKPLIVNFSIQHAGANTWIFSGDVVDPDDDVANFIVEFRGVYPIRSAVDDAGHFEFAVILFNGEYGVEYAITRDPHGLASDEAYRDMGIMT